MDIYTQQRLVESQQRAKINRLSCDQVLLSMGAEPLAAFLCEIGMSQYVLSPDRVDLGRLRKELDLPNQFRDNRQLIRRV